MLLWTNLRPLVSTFGSWKQWLSSVCQKQKKLFQKKRRRANLRWVGSPSPGGALAKPIRSSFRTWSWCGRCCWYEILLSLFMLVMLLTVTVMNLMLSMLKVRTEDVDAGESKWPLFYFLIWLYFVTDSIRPVNFADLPSWSPNLLKPTMMLPADMVRSPCFQMTRFSPRASTSQESKTSRSWKKRISVLASYQRFKQFL